MSLALRIFAGFAVAIGLVWSGQGTGIFPFPPSSFMISQMAWTWRGAGLVAVGIAAFVAARRV